MTKNELKRYRQVYMRPCRGRACATRKPGVLESSGAGEAWPRPYDIRDHAANLGTSRFAMSGDRPCTTSQGHCRGEAMPRPPPARRVNIKRRAFCNTILS